MICGNIFTSTDLQNHKKNHTKKSQNKVQPGQWLLPEKDVFHEWSSQESQL